ncbi:tannase/feruloyl esterase family alpha/beta hydrolase [Frankia sp. AgW1.1]|uniref:tannase/feruloyl esterase family alpha/beta hydrolase n=1 Tax=Frankia sp. AgW1.1 TaxID=1836971 RepID=UPI0019325A0E|nr:tannase/feruloyl esterase family alpha/beta hydrolase [Frankia sp. AgW1.1]MBL7622472.1 tannase/feruloyl esterase family alpha/beta hydrolase [Frankia sp. AgB1.8]
MVVAAAGSAPAYCSVKGFVAPRVDFELKLPVATWQGRYLQEGCGGLCGFVIPTSFPACDAQLGGDFALAATDDGHATSNPFSAEWAAGDEQARVDLGYRGVHVVAVAAKEIMSLYYGRPPIYSYFNGCSDGGREALVEVQRYPHDFNGVIAGAPAAYFPFLPAEATAWVARANTDPTGAPILTAAKLPALHAAVLAACDSLDGLVDGQIDDPRACHFDPTSMRCPDGTDRPDCLTQAQVTAVRTIYSPPVDTAGQLLYPGGEEPGSEASWAGPPIPWINAAPGGTGLAASTADGYLRYVAFPAGQPGVALSDWSFTAAGFHSLLAEAGIVDALDPDLRAFRAAGGKLIMYHGWADALIPPEGTVAYYQAVQDHMGGLAATTTFARLFMFPGMFHCGGGGPSTDTSDLIHQLVTWTEHGTAPTQAIATQTDTNGHIVRTRPVYPYPTVARYTGTGSTNDAANFVPTTPTTRPDDHIHWLGENLLH